MATGHFDQLGKLLVAPGALADVAWIDAQLGQRRRRLGHFGEQLVAIEVEVADQRHIEVHGQQAIPDGRHCHRRFPGIHGDADEF